MATETYDDPQAFLAALKGTRQKRGRTTRAASPAVGRWEAVQAALIGVAEKRITQSVFDTTWAKRKAEGGALAQLLEAYDAYTRECDRLGAELARLDTAQTEINAAWLATNDLQEMTMNTYTHKIHGRTFTLGEILQLLEDLANDPHQTYRHVAREMLDTYNRSIADRINGAGEFEDDDE